MITVVQKVVNYVRNTLYQGREPDENGFYIYNTSEIARAIGTSPRQISIRKEAVEYVLKTNYDLSKYGKYPEYEGESIFTNVIFCRGILKFSRNPITFKKELEYLWALKPIGDGDLEEEFDDNHQRIEFDPEQRKKELRDKELAEREAEKRAKKEAEKAEKEKLKFHISSELERILESWRFNAHGKLVEAIIKKGVEIIPDRAFQECAALKKVHIPIGVREIGSHAFDGCRKLKGIILPNTVKFIGYNAFFKCESLEQIVIPENVREILSNTFFYCQSLKYVYLPSRIIRIESGAFLGTKIEYIELPKGIIWLDKGAFGSSNEVVLHAEIFKKSGTTKTEEHISDVLRPVLKTYKLNDRGYVESFELKEDVHELPDEAFANGFCPDRLVVPSGITRIGKRAFAVNGWPRHIDLPDSIQTIDDFAFYGDFDLEEVKLPKELLSIGEGAFERCNYIHKIYVNQKLTRIMSRAFYGCYFLKTFTIPDSVKNIGEDVFWGCEDLKYIYISPNCSVKEELEKQIKEYLPGCEIVVKKSLDIK